MSVLLAVLMIAAVLAISAGLISSLAILFALNDPGSREPLGIQMYTGPVYWTFTAWTVAIGFVLIFAPASWFGPTWSYFPGIPHNGFWMGVCLVALSAALSLALWRRWSKSALAVWFFLIGFVYWFSGITLLAEGLLGHQGLMEGPFMLYVGGHAFAHSALLTAAAVMPDVMNASFGATVAVAVVPSSGLWGLVQYVISRREKKQKLQREEFDEETAEQNRHALLAEAQATAQRTALESADKRFAGLHEDYRSCQASLTSVREVTWLMIDILESFLMRLQPVEGGNGTETYTTVVNLGEVGEARRAINEARNRLR